MEREDETEFTLTEVAEGLTLPKDGEPGSELEQEVCEQTGDWLYFIRKVDARGFNFRWGF